MLIDSGPHIVDVVTDAHVQVASVMVGLQGLLFGLIKVAFFRHVAGVAARRIYDPCQNLEEEAEYLEFLVRNFQDCIQPCKNLTFLRHIYFS